MTESLPAAAPRPPTAAVLIIGNEILSGRTQDTNLAYLARGLGRLGVRLVEARVIPDVAETIIATVNDLRARHDYLFTTGGIGPTHDDITAECVARAFGVELVLDEEAKRRLVVRYQAMAAKDPTRRIDLNPARLRMAHVPAGARLIDNPVSAAPGFQIGNVFVMAGVPDVARAMFDGIADRLVGGPPILAKSVSCRLPEGTLAGPLTAIQTRFPTIEIGSYPYWTATGFGVSLVLRATDADLLALGVEQVAAMVRDLGDTPVIADAL